MTEVLNGVFSRRMFLKGGGALIVGFSLTGAAVTAEASGAPPDASLPIDVDQVDSYLTVHPDNTVTVYHSVMERGQGSGTGMLQIAAEELDVGMHQISHAPLDSSTTPLGGSAGGSQGLTIGGSYVRAAAATAKQALLALASANLGVSQQSVSVNGGVVSGGGKSVTYGQLIGGKLFNVAIPQSVQRTTTAGWPSAVGLRPGLEPGQAPAKPISEYKLVTKPIPRVDVPDMVTGAMVYSGDVRVPGMLHGRVVRPRGQSSLLNRVSTDFNATNYALELALGGGRAPLAIDQSSIAHLKDVQIVRVGNFIGVVAPDEYEAVEAAAQLKVTWAEPTTPLPGNGNLASTLRETAGNTSTLLTDTGNDAVGFTQTPMTALLSTWMGDVDAGLAQAAKTISATYRTSYLVHGALGPHVAIADVTPAECDDHPPVRGRSRSRERWRRDGSWSAAGERTGDQLPRLQLLRADEHRSRRADGGRADVEDRRQTRARADLCAGTSTGTTTTTLPTSSTFAPGLTRTGSSLRSTMSVICKWTDFPPRHGSPAASTRSRTAESSGAWRPDSLRPLTSAHPAIAPPRSRPSKQSTNWRTRPEWIRSSSAGKT